MTVDVPGGTQQQYDQIAATVVPEAKLPEGWVIHIAGPSENGWRVINDGAVISLSTWDTAEQTTTAVQIAAAEQDHLAAMIEAVEDYVGDLAFF